MTGDCHVRICGSRGLRCPRPPDHHGYHWLCDYQMDTVSNDSLVRNPERSTALALLRSHESAVAELERTIGKHTTTPTDSETDHTLNKLRASLDAARADVQTARAALKPIPAKLPANVIDPDAQRAIPHTNR